MYHVHKTLGFVLFESPIKEANSFVIVFTRELGLIKATAQGAQKISSKLRYGLQKFSLSQLSFIYGKHSWKITNVVPQENIFYRLRENKEKMTIVGNVGALLQRLVTGEEKNEELFDLVMNAFSFLEASIETKDELMHFEFLFVLRILYHLGYVSGSGGLELLAHGNEWTVENVTALSHHKKEAVSVINRAIVESQL